MQGASKYTEKKELHIEGITGMRVNQFKNKYFQQRCRKVMLADVFCGSGQNVVEGKIIDGSPIRILNGYFKSKNNKLDDVDFSFWFSDLDKGSCRALTKLIKKDFETISNNFEDLPDCKIHTMEASLAINKLGDFLEKHKDCYMFLLLDPNGPKDFPKYEVQDLISSYSNRLDVVPYISATAINRCIGARSKAKKEFVGWLGEIENFDEGFVSFLQKDSRSGWIRDPIPGDIHRWTLIPTWGSMHPKDTWKNKGYYNLDSEKGKQIIKTLCGGFNYDN